MSDSPSMQTYPNRLNRPALLMIIAGVGIAVWIWQTFVDTSAAWRGLLMAFLFFTTTAAGLVVWPAVVIAAHGRWSPHVERPALGAIFFAPGSLLLFAALWIGRSHWATWIGRTGPQQSWWLAENFVFARNAAGLVIFWLLAWAFVRRRTKGRPVVLAPILIVTYCLIFTFVGFDLVMALDPKWFSSLFGGYFFISGMYMAAAAWCLLAILGGCDTSGGRLRDLGNLVLAFSILTTYMMYSQLLPIWYENLPQEVRYVIPRLMQGPGKWISAVLLGGVYLGPLAMLLWRRSRLSRVYLGAVAGLVLCLMWLERWWEVAPTLTGGHLQIGLAEVSITLAMASAFVASVNMGMKKLPEIRDFGDGHTELGTQNSEL